MKTRAAPTAGAPAPPRRAARPFPAPARPADGADLDERWRRAARLGHRYAGVDGGKRVAGLPEGLRDGLESLSGARLSDVRVHYDSPLPARFAASALARGRDIHLGPGEERHLPHEAWHVVQQKQLRVRPEGRSGGPPIGDDPALEREASEMGQRAARHAPAVPPPAAGAPAPPPTSSPAAAAPIQLHRWTWDANTRTWSRSDGSNTNAPPPQHEGRYHGDEFEDSYGQSSDPTVTPFLSKGESFLGESGARKQLKGTAPSASEIRVPSKTTPELHGGSGLHEVAPTNLRGEIAKSKNPVLVGLQSGFRTSTSRQLFRRKTTQDEAVPGSDEVGTHTGFTRRGKGLSRTKGQGPAHDKLRETARGLEQEKDPYKAINELGLTHLASQPPGGEVLASSYLSGTEPNIKSIGTIEAPGPTPGTERIRLAQTTHRGRERVKKRLRSVKRKTGRGRSPSPPRTDIDDQGRGGEYVTDPAIDYPLSPLPHFEGSSDFETTANASAWISAPQREGFKFGPPTWIPAPTTTPPTSTPPTSTLPISTPPPTLTLPPTSIPPPTSTPPIPGPQTSTPPLLTSPPPTSTPPPVLTPFSFTPPPQAPPLTTTPPTTTTPTPTVTLRRSPRKRTQRPTTTTTTTFGPQQKKKRR